jgi:hypothetical protein
MRANSRRARARSNQWNAWPAATRSTDASPSPVASAVPSTLTKRGSAARRRSAAPRIAALGSTPYTVQPRRRSGSLESPVPEPTSATALPAVSAAAATSVSASASG